MQSNKSTILYDAIKRKIEILASDIPNEDIELNMQLKSKHSFYSELLAKQITNTSKDSSKVKELKSALFDVDEKLAIHTKKMSSLYPEYFSLTESSLQLPTKEDVIQNLNDDDGILMFFKGKQTYLLELYKTGINFQPLDSSVNGQVNKFRKLVSTKPSNKDDVKRLHYLGSELGQTLLTTALNEQISNLAIVTDGNFSQIPFEALTYQNSYLIQQCNVAYYLSLEQYINEKTSDHQKTQNIYCIAPDFTNPKISSKINLPEGLSTLPYAKEEVDFLTNLFNVGDTINYSTTISVVAEQLGNYSIIHLATHATLNDQDAMLSEIFFSDGTMSIYDIQSLNINPDFIVLSACNTGVGESQKGEGIISFSRGFFHAGVRSLQSSLWSLDDYSSAQIIKKMYENLKSGMKKSIALKKAKTDYLNGADKLRSHPYFWAGLIHIGNESPLFKKSVWQKDCLLYGLLGICLLMLTVFLLRKKKTI